MNNGIMWFDPTPGGAELAGARQALPDQLHPGAWRRPPTAGALAVGASGGRRILPAVTQLLSFVMDFGMDLDAAIHQPRIDASEGAIVIGDVRLPADAREALRRAFRLRRGARPDLADEVRLPQRGAARRRNQQRRDRDVPAVGRRGGGGLTLAS